MLDDKTSDRPTGGEKDRAPSDVHAPENICPAPVVIAELPVSVDRRARSSPSCRLLSRGGRDAARRR